MAPAPAPAVPSLPPATPGPPWQPTRAQLKQLITQLKPGQLSSSPAVDVELTAFLAAALDAYVCTWYGHISDDTELIAILVRHFYVLVTNLEARLRAVDWVAFLCLDVPEVLRRHLKDVRHCRERTDTVYAGGQPFADRFHGMQPHAALGKGPDHELEYLRHVAQLFLDLLLPADQMPSISIRYIVREALTTQIFHAMLDMVAQPDFLYSILELVLAPADTAGPGAGSAPANGTAAAASPAPAASAASSPFGAAVNASGAAGGAVAAATDEDDLSPSQRYTRPSRHPRAPAHPLQSHAAAMAAAAAAAAASGSTVSTAAAAAAAASSASAARYRPDLLNPEGHGSARAASRSRSPLPTGHDLPTPSGGGSGDGRGRADLGLAPPAAAAVNPPTASSPAGGTAAPSAAAKTPKDSLFGLRLGAPRIKTQLAGTTPAGGLAVTGSTTPSSPLESHAADAFPAVAAPSVAPVDVGSGLASSPTHGHWPTPSAVLALSKPDERSDRMVTKVTRALGFEKLSRFGRDKDSVAAGSTTGGGAGEGLPPSTPGGPFGRRGSSWGPDDRRRGKGDSASLKASAAAAKPGSPPSPSRLPGAASAAGGASPDAAASSSPASLPLSAGSSSATGNSSTETAGGRRVVSHHAGSDRRARSGRDPLDALEAPFSSAAVASLAVTAPAASASAPLATSAAVGSAAASAVPEHALPYLGQNPRASDGGPAGPPALCTGGALRNGHETAADGGDSGAIGARGGYPPAASVDAASTSEAPDMAAATLITGPGHVMGSATGDGRPPTSPPAQTAFRGRPRGRGGHAGSVPTAVTAPIRDGAVEPLIGSPDSLGVGPGPGGRVNGGSSSPTGKFRRPDTVGPCSPSSAPAPALAPASPTTEGASAWSTVMAAFAATPLTAAFADVAPPAASPSASQATSPPDGRVDDRGDNGGSSRGGSAGAGAVLDSRAREGGGDRRKPGRGHRGGSGRGASRRRDREAPSLVKQSGAWLLGVAQHGMQVAQWVSAVWWSLVLLFTNTARPSAADTSTGTILTARGTPYACVPYRIDAARYDAVALEAHLVHLLSEILGLGKTQKWLWSQLLFFGMPVVQALFRPVVNRLILSGLASLFSEQSVMAYLHLGNARLWGADADADAALLWQGSGEARRRHRHGDRHGHQQVDHETHRGDGRRTPAAVGPRATAPSSRSSAASTSAASSRSSSSSSASSSRSFSSSSFSPTSSFSPVSLLPPPPSGPAARRPQDDPSHAAISPLAGCPPPPPAAPPTRAETRAAIRARLMALTPDLVHALLGRRAVARAYDEALEAFSDARVNKHLVYVLWDLLLVHTIDELRAPTAAAAAAAAAAATIPPVPASPVASSAGPPSPFAGAYRPGLGPGPGLGFPPPLAAYSPFAPESSAASAAMAMAMHVPPPPPPPPAAPTASGGVPLPPFATDPVHPSAASPQAATLASTWEPQFLPPTDPLPGPAARRHAAFGGAVSMPAAAAASSAAWHPSGGRSASVGVLSPHAAAMAAATAAAVVQAANQRTLGRSGGADPGPGPSGMATTASLAGNANTTSTSLAPSLPLPHYGASPGPPARLAHARMGALSAVFEGQVSE